MNYIAGLLNAVCSIYVYLIIIRVLLSWFSPDPYNPLYRALLSITEPIMDPFRRIIPPLAGIDLSPIVIILIIEYILKGMLIPFIAVM
jgi:YggT family protein